MPNESQIVKDRRGFVFTIEGLREPVYQVDAKQWARAEHLWSESDIPPEIRAKFAQLRSEGKPGAFVQFSGIDAGVYLICEEHIQRVPGMADQAELVLDPPPVAASGRRLSPGDIVISAKGGLIYADSGDVLTTEPGAYYVVSSQTWGRFVPDPATQLPDVETTKDILILLDRLNGNNYLSMSPDPAEDGYAVPLPETIDPGYHITCYVLNLARFTRESVARDL
jgi:hypothetical protein